MPHHTPLIGTIVVGLVVAFLLGALAQRFRLSPLVGYLLAGVVVGPFTPGFVADTALAMELAEIGVILLMFGVGLHFSLSDLLSVKAIAIPGAVVQIAVATALGLGLATLLGWSVTGGVVFGLSLSVASTVVLLRALQERRLVETERGRIAVGWLVVEDLVMVVALVLLPALASATGGNGEAPAPGMTQVAEIVALTLGKIAAFMALMVIVGRRLIPWLLHRVVHTGSRELFRLAVLAIALGVAYGSAMLFDVSFALGAFFAGMVLSESPLSQRAAEETLPLRDAFAVLFFVSVGMLFNPAILTEQTLLVIATVAIIVVGKSIAAYLIVVAFGRSRATALTISASLAQIGEFSFILAGLGVALGVLPPEGRDLILASAILSILFNPVAFSVVERLIAPAAVPRPAVPAEKPAAAPARSLGATPPEAATGVVTDADQAPDAAALPRKDHAILVGYGKVGALIAAGLRNAGRDIALIADRDDTVARARQDGFEPIIGNATDPETLEAADIEGAADLFVAIPDVFEAGNLIRRARAGNPGLTIVARARSTPEAEHLLGLGADNAITGEHEIARGMLDQCVACRRQREEAAGASAPATGPGADGVTKDGAAPAA
ncbi:cation:proton antiporter [Prosthecomicrobium pneumaticum]|uniref:CPA2 family monovalent cation:H+ antiporter-2 n=1 Tax=Prosthecomicrobium pneumaticum TaxID=81895 RepID=A0A7W9FIV5_9HYPH|nr:cation:proton antiporter [Prosthecomicrobium pneumaticum]MBB5751077.1 CPA2 family monovalent cation:H+ antiporter-2 [Prosthecomicrobium pneumaticum]